MKKRRSDLIIEFVCEKIKQETLDHSKATEPKRSTNRPKKSKVLK
jgi:uncharacterized protein (DUF2237 family)